MWCQETLNEALGSSYMAWEADRGMGTPDNIICCCQVFLHGAADLAFLLVTPDTFQ